MTYATIKDGESTPLHEGRCSADSTTSAAPSTKKRASSSIVRAMMVGTAVAVGTLLLMAGPSKRTTRNTSSHVDGMVVVSSATEYNACYDSPATVTFSGLSCKDSKGYCAGPHGLWEEPGVAKAMHDYETRYVSQNGYCWSRSVTLHVCYGAKILQNCETVYDRCDPVGYFDGDNGYNDFGFWHVSTPLSDGSCGDPCREFMSD